MGGNQCHPSGVAYQDDFVCQPFGLYVKMKYRTVFIDDQFGRGEIVFSFDRVFNLLFINRNAGSRFLFTGFGVSVSYFSSYLLNGWLVLPVVGLAMFSRMEVSASIFFIR